MGNNFEIPSSHINQLGGRSLLKGCEIVNGFFSIGMRRMEDEVTHEGSETLALDQLRY